MLHWNHAMQGISNRIRRLERVLGLTEKEYRFDLTVILEDDVTDDYILARQKVEPHKRFRRFSDFVDELF